MCMARAHRLAGFATGAALATLAHQPAWVAVASACLASATAGGITSPDVDQYRVWRALDRWLPDEWLGEGGPLQHRGISHWWGLPMIAALALIGFAPNLWFAWMLLAGWVSHLVADWAVGAGGYGRAAGIPLAPWWGHVGLGFKCGGFVEAAIRLVSVGALVPLFYVIALR